MLAKSIDSGLLPENNLFVSQKNSGIPTRSSRPLENSAPPKTPRCLLIDVDQFVDLGPINRVDSANEQFDVILSLTQDSLQELDFELVLARCSNPAAPLISLSRHFGPRADVILTDTSSSSIASALLLVQPLIKQIAALPPILQGVDRLSLLALTLAYTRNLGLGAAWAADARTMVRYPLLLGIPNSRPMLEELAAIGLLRRRFFEKTFTCGRCESSRMMVREVCTECRSSDILKHPLLHHYYCGFQGVQTLFRQGDNHCCPKCEKRLRHYGLDYDKPGVAFECQACAAVMSEPDAYFACTDCGSHQASDGANRQTWYHYEITGDGIAAVQSGVLPSRDIDDTDNKLRSLRDFRVLSRQAIALAAEHTRPIMAFRMKIDTNSASTTLGPARTGDIKLFAQEIACQFLRSTDLVAALPDGIVACLPETQQSGAEQIVRQIEHALAEAVKSDLKPGFEIYPAATIGSLFEALR